MSSIYSPPGTRLLRIFVLFWTNLFATELALRTFWGKAIFLTLRTWLLQLLFKIFLLLILLLQITGGMVLEAFFRLWDSGPKICWARILLSWSLEALVMRARLQQVVPFLVEAMARSADNFIAFFLSMMLVLFFEEKPHLWRPNIHFLRNSCLSVIGWRILHKQTSCYS